MNQCGIESCCLSVLDFFVYFCTYVCDGQTQRHLPLKLPVESLPSYLDSQCTAPISFGKINVFSFWPSQQSCLHCCSATLFSLTKLAKAWESCSAVQQAGSKKKIGGDVSGEKMLMMSLALCVFWVCNVELLLMMFSQFFRFELVWWS